MHLPIESGLKSIFNAILVAISTGIRRPADKAVKSELKTVSSHLAELKFLDFEAANTPLLRSE